MVTLISLRGKMKEKTFKAQKGIFKRLSFDANATSDIKAQVIRTFVNTDVSVPGQECIKEERIDPSARARGRWKSAIMNQILLIRMEKENKKLVARITATETRRQKLCYPELSTFSAESAKAWDELLRDNNKERVDSQVLLQTVRGGVPRARRGEVWQFLIEQHSFRTPSKSENQCWKDACYRQLVEKPNLLHQHAILIDLGRTFPAHEYFTTRLGAGQLSLFNLLKAYAILDAEVGYCQGLSFVAGLLLMHMDEQDVFGAFCHVMYELEVRNQYKPDMVAVKQQLYQLSRLLDDYYPALYDHLDRHEVTPALYAAPWFLTLFASQYPVGFVSRVMDLIFLQGMEVVFKVALVMVGKHVESILKCDNFESIVEYLKTKLPEACETETDDICTRALDMDIKWQLNLYEAEYQLLDEKMIDNRQNREKLAKQEAKQKDLEKTVSSLKNELVEAKTVIEMLKKALLESTGRNKELELKLSALESEQEFMRLTNNCGKSETDGNSDSSVMSPRSEEVQRLLAPHGHECTDERSWELVPSPDTITHEMDKLVERVRSIDGTISPSDTGSELSEGDSGSPSACSAEKTFSDPVAKPSHPIRKRPSIPLVNLVPKILDDN